MTVRRLSRVRVSCYKRRMANDPDNLVLEHLRPIRTTVDETRDRLSRVEVRLSAIEGHLGKLVLSEAGQNLEIDKLRTRIDRIERRLELTD